MAGRRQPVDLVGDQTRPYQAGTTTPTAASNTTKQPASSGSDTPDTGGGSAGGRRTPRPPAGRRPPANTTLRVPAPAAVDSGAGFLLALIVWGWFGLPMLKGGPAQVRKTLRAKFLNQAPDGSWLP